MGEEDNSVQDDGDKTDTDSTVHKIKYEDGAEEDNKSTEDDEATVETADNEDENESRVDDEPQPKLEEEEPPRPRTVRELDCSLNGKYWADGMVGSVIHECCVGSVIQEYGNFKAILSTPQYRFQTGMKEFKE